MAKFSWPSVRSPLGTFNYLAFRSKRLRDHLLGPLARAPQVLCADTPGAVSSWGLSLFATHESPADSDSASHPSVLLVYGSVFCHLRQYGAL